MTIDSGAVWKPSEHYLASSRLIRLMQRNGVDSYEAFYRRSVEDIEWFWELVVRDELELDWFEPYERVLDLSAGPMWPSWFPGGKFNYVANAVDRHARGENASKLAISWEGEEGQRRSLSYGELEVQVSRLAAGLHSLGIGIGDRIGLFMPMLPETAIAVLACSKIGAIFIPTFSGYGAEAVAVRLRDAGARLLITADGFYRRGRVIGMKETADEAAGLAPTVEKVLVVPRLDRDVPWHDERDVRWDELMAQGPEIAPTEQTASDDPFMIIYTSGTTGRPKGAYHLHTGFPIKAAQDMAHLFDVQASDTMFWFTDLGWMMGPWAITGTLILGATLLLYDGTPDYTGPDRMWELVSRHNVTHLGISPTVIRALMPLGEEWPLKHDLSTLRVLGSSGEPWNPSSWDWYFRHIGGERCPIINYSGGTEVSGGILGCTTIQTIKSTSFTTAVPGMAADVFDDSGHPIRGDVGELVVTKPWVGMTHGFWQDRERYEEAYWSRFPGVWTHGDWAMKDEEGFWYILGRSDDTLKVAGKRVGPAEVESAAVAHPAVLEAAAIGVPHEVKGETVTVFVVLRSQFDPSENLRGEIRAEVGRQLGKALLPEEVRFCQDLPKTRNAKIMRRVIRAKYLDADLGDLSSLDNPDALEAIGRSS